MKRLLSVCLLMLCLSLPVFAGHIIVGGHSEFCECGGPVPECTCDDGEVPHGQSTQQPPTDFGSESLLLLTVLLVALRYKL